MSAVRETFIGIVVENEDDEQRGRIKVACAALMGVDDNGDPVEYPAWVSPAFPILSSSDGEVADSGFFAVPNIGVTVEFEITVSSSFDQMPGQSSISNPDPRWRACLLQPGDSLSEDFTTDYPHRMGWRSPKGHLLLFNNADDSERVTLRHGGADGDGAGSYISFEPGGSVILGTENGQLIYINDEDGKQAITLLDGNKNLIGLSDGQVSIVQGKKSHMIVMNDSGVFVTAAGVCTVTANDVSLSASSVNLGANAAEAVIKGNTFQTIFNAHTHTGNLGGPTSPPLVPLTGSELSTVSSTE